MSNVEKPNHYQLKGLEPYQTVDVIKSVLGKYIKYFYIGNILKYTIRAEKKNGLEDYKKADVYLKWLIEWESLTEEEKEQNLREIEVREIKEELEEDICCLEQDVKSAVLSEQDKSDAIMVLSVLENKVERLKEEFEDDKDLFNLSIRLGQIEYRLKGDW